jgi:ABC-2 type transport system permease protein
MSAIESVHPAGEASEPAFGFWRRSYAMLVKWSR